MRHLSRNALGSHADKCSGQSRLQAEQQEMLSQERFLGRGRKVAPEECAEPINGDQRFGVRGLMFDVKQAKRSDGTFNNQKGESHDGQVDTKKALRISSGALLCRSEDALLNFNKVRITRADHPLGIHEAVDVNCDPAAVQEHEVRVPDQPEMVRPVSLDEEFFGMPAETEHFAMTGPELFLVYGRRLVGATHVRLVRARTCSRFILVYVWSATFDFCLSAYACAGLRFRLRLIRFLLRAHFLCFRWGSSLRFVGLPLRLLRLRLLA